MTGSLVFLLSFLGWFLFLAGFTSWPAAALPLLIVSSMIAVLYGASLADLLLPGAYSLAVLGLVLGIAGVCRSRARGGGLFSKLREPGPVLFFLLAALLRLVLAGTQYSQWDEFSHWGFAAKELFLRNSLPASESVLFFKDYPPGTALFQYYMTFFTGWSEGATVFAQVLLLLAAAVALLQNTSWKQGPRIAVVLSLSYLFIVLFKYKPQSLYVDQVLGILFGTSIASCLIGEDGKYGTGARILPTLFILPLIKVAGLLLAVTAAAAVVTNHLLAIRSPGNGKTRLGAFCLCAALLLAPLIAAQSWNWRVRKMGFERYFKTSLSLSAVRNSFSASAPEHDRIILSAFGKDLVKMPVARATPPIALIVILSLAAFVAWRKEPRAREKLQIRAAFSWLFAGSVIFAFGLLLLYLFAFSSREGIRLASFDRYMGIPFLGWSVVTTAFFLRLPHSPAPAGYARYAWLPIVLAAALLLVFGSFDTPGEKRMRKQHDKLQKLADAAVLRTRDNARIYIVWQGSYGIHPVQLAYELAPRLSSIWGGGWSLGKPRHSWSLGKSGDAKDVWTVDMTPDDWRNMLKHYDFVLLGQTDAQFWDRFGELFEKRDIAATYYLFQVTAKNGVISLSPIPNAHRPKAIPNDRRPLGRRARAR